MASVLARQAAGGLRYARVASLGCTRRAIHITPVVQKRKGKVVIEDLFGESFEEEPVKPTPSLKGKAAGVTQASRIPAASTSTGATVTAQAQAPKRRKLSPEARLAKFNQIRDFVTPRLGRKPAIKVPQVKKSAWIHLLQLAETGEQLTQVADMFPGWKESGHQFDPEFSELFVRRCEEISCPLLALKVYGDFAKYNLALTLPGARQLLHSLHVEHPIETVMTASALYDVYGLPPIAKDLVSCSMLMSACYKHNSKDSLKVANALVPHLEKLLKHTKPIEVSKGPTVNVLQKPVVWMKWALKKVDKALFATTGQRADWLSAWRAKSGHIPEPSKF
ncbi:hypothetical protein Hypma_001597 [Hypsizygus marmoreus]|uniref:Uncharacterized protein n=1 Tax=Hypsizygus marmoreus TaxID=39966 RepID=A0A369J5W4_HYPMA|nr:hypothetical protein Hypma_001597 [Hypsizygus marmoreus]